MTLVKRLWNSARFGWWDAHPYSRWDVKRQAELDGRLETPVPSPNDKVAPWYIGAMKESFDNIVRGILGKFQSEDESHRARITELERGKAASAAELKRSEKVYSDACAYFAKFYPNVPPNSVKRRVIGYWAITLFLFFLELPMNFTAFKLFGDNANYITGATAVAIGGALLVLAHYAGIAWEKGPMKDRKAMIDMIVVVGLAFLAIFSVAQLRTAYLLNNPDVKLHDSSTLMRAFAVFNLMLFGCATFISRRRHLTGLDLVQFSQASLKECRENFHALEKQLSVEKQLRESLRVASETDAHRVTDQHLEMTKLYLMYNRRVRKMQDGDGLLCPPFLEGDGASVSSLVSLPKHFGERILDENAVLSEDLAQGLLPADPTQSHIPVGVEAAEESGLSSDGAQPGLDQHGEHHMTGGKK